MTDIGKYRSENQDSFHILSLDDSVVLATVCDGMGGAAGGQIASSLALKCYEDALISQLHQQNIQFTDNSTYDADILEGIMKEAIKAANREVFDYAKDAVDLLGMGTTLVSCLAIGAECLICNVGDSRLYHLTKTSMKQVTRDHSYVQMLVDTGMLERDLARAHPDRNIITRAVGTRPVVTAETFRLSLQRDEAILLCSDGLSNYVSNEMIYSIIWGSKAIFDIAEEEKVKTLIHAANEGGGRDNITAVLLTY